MEDDIFSSRNFKITNYLIAPQLLMVVKLLKTIKVEETTQC